MTFDLILKGGRLIDPKNGIDATKDLAISKGVIAAADDDIPVTQAARTIDVTGLIVTPGLVDIHAHMYATPGHRNAWAGDNSILPDGFSFRTGVTTMVDTGSAGWRNFEDYRLRVLDRFRTRMFAYLNICGLGMMSNNMEQNIHDMDVDELVRVARENEDIVVGSKTAHYWGPDWTSVDRAIAGARQIQKPVMIDFGNFPEERPYYQLVTQKLQKDDISTHCYRADVPWLGPDGKVLKYLHIARERGVIFDVGHGGGSLNFRNAVPACEQGFFPDSISTDLHTGSMNGGMMDMATTMSKFVVMGMPLVDVIRASTSNPANEIGHPELGHLTVGAVADVAVLDLLEGNFGYRDAQNGKLEGKQRLVCEMTLKDGRVVWDWNSRFAEDYRTMDPTAGVRNPEGLIMPPPELT